MPALERMRVLDMTQFEAGTSCTLMLAWLGADVVKLERPGPGDPGRHLQGAADNSAYFLNWNCNKRGVALNLQTPAGRDLLLRMVPKFDVFVENYGPGVIEKLDIGYDVMQERNPQIIYARLKGFGLSGPYAQYNSFDRVAQATGGTISVTGRPDQRPFRPGPTIGDCGTGFQLALGITAAYVQRLQSGRGQLIEISMQEGAAAFMRTVIALDGDWGRTAAPRPGTPDGEPYELYPCAPGDPNDYVTMAPVSTEQWDRLCLAMERPELLVDDRFATDQARVQHHQALYDSICEWTAQRPKHEVMNTVAAAGVPCGAVLDTHDLWTDPHLNARNFIHKVDHPTEGTLEIMRSAILMGDSEVSIQPAPLLGQHTDEVLAAELGLSSDELADLRAARVIA